MLKLIGMLLRLYHPSITYRSCGYIGVADMRYRVLLLWFALMLVALVFYVAIASLFVWAALWFSLNWPVGIFSAAVAFHFLVFHTPDLSCPKCERVS